MAKKREIVREDEKNKILKFIKKDKNTALLNIMSSDFFVDATTEKKSDIIKCYNDNFLSLGKGQGKKKRLGKGSRRKGKTRVGKRDSSYNINPRTYTNYSRRTAPRRKTRKKTVYHYDYKYEKKRKLDIEIYKKINILLGELNKKERETGPGLGTLSKMPKIIKKHYKNGNIVLFLYSLFFSWAIIGGYFGSPVGGKESMEFKNTSIGSHTKLGDLEWFSVNYWDNLLEKLNSMNRREIRKLAKVMKKINDRVRSR